MGDDSDQLGRERPATDALALLYDRFAPALYRTACGLLGSAADAEDVVHDVFVALARGRAQLPAIINARSYLFVALRRMVVRRTVRRSPGPLPDDMPDTRKPPERDEHLDQALARLPAEQREVVVLKIDGDLTFAELADVLGISPNTAASRYRYAMEKLRADLERDE
jgi:RNA polymerase sigma-70 factor (ECF subfamily)